MTHYLKCWPDFFDAVADGRKTFEVRKNDRGFQAGDKLFLRKWDPKAQRYVNSHGGLTSVSLEAAFVDVRVHFLMDRAMAEKYNG